MSYSFVLPYAQWLAQTTVVKLLPTKSVWNAITVKALTQSTFPLLLAINNEILFIDRANNKLFCSYTICHIFHTCELIQQDQKIVVLNISTNIIVIRFVKSVTEYNNTFFLHGYRTIKLLIIFFKLHIAGIYLFLIHCVTKYFFH